jgi:hypothetical protein
MHRSDALVETLGSVDKIVALAAGDTAGLQRVAAHMIRCLFSLNRIITVNKRQHGRLSRRESWLTVLSRPLR